MSLRKLRPVATLLGHSSWSLRCAISGDGKTALSGDGIPSARIWDLDNPSKSREFLSDLPLGIRQCALTNDGSLAVVAADGHGISIVDVATGKHIYSVNEPTHPKSQFSAGGCALSPDGDILVATFRTTNRAFGQIHIIKWRSLELDEKIIKRDYSIWQCEISEDGRRIAFKYWKGTKSGVELIDVRSGKSLGNWEGLNGEWNFSIDAKARMLATADVHNLSVVDMVSGDTRAMESYTFSAFAGIDISSDGNHIVAPLADHKFGIWETATGKLVALLGGHQNRTNGCAINSDGTRVITCSNDHTVRLWDTTGATDGSGADEVRQALKSMLAGDQIATEDFRFVLNALSTCELWSTGDLLQAHAALVIALRSAAAKNQMGTRDQLKDTASKVYATIEGKLHDKGDVQLGQVVMAHAEQRGLLSSGEPTKHMGTYYKLSDKSVNRLRDNVNEAWKEIVPVPASSHAVDSISKSLDGLFTKMRVGQEGVENGLFSNIASCVLLLWSCKNEKKNLYKSSPRSIKSILSMDQKADVAWIETKMPFDISSPRVLRYLIKRSSIEKLGPRKKHLVQKAILKSKFQSVEKVESELTALIEKLARARGKFQSVMDIDIDDLACLPDSDDEGIMKKQKSLPSPPPDTKTQVEQIDEREANIPQADIGSRESVATPSEILQSSDPTSDLDGPAGIVKDTPHTQNHPSEKESEPKQIERSLSPRMTKLTSMFGEPAEFVKSSSNKAAPEKINLESDTLEEPKEIVQIENVSVPIGKMGIETVSDFQTVQEVNTVSVPVVSVELPNNTGFEREGKDVGEADPVKGKSKDVGMNPPAPAPVLNNLDRKSVIPEYVPEAPEASENEKEDENEEAISKDKAHTSIPIEEVQDTIDASNSPESRVRSATDGLSKLERKKRRDKTNAILGIVAILIFFICAALLAIVVIKVR